MDDEIYRVNKTLQPKHLLDQRLSTILLHTWVSKLLAIISRWSTTWENRTQWPTLCRGVTIILGTYVHAQAMSRPEFKLFDAFHRVAESLPEVISKV